MPNWARQQPQREVQGTKGETLKGALGLYRGFMRLYKGHMAYIKVLGLGVPSRGPSYCPLGSAESLLSNC